MQLEKALKPAIPTERNFTPAYCYRQCSVNVILQKNIAEQFAITIQFIPVSIEKRSSNCALPIELWIKICDNQRKPINLIMTASSGILIPLEINATKSRASRHFHLEIRAVPHFLKENPFGNWHRDFIYIHYLK